MTRTSNDRAEHGVNRPAQLRTDERIQQWLHVSRGQLLVCFRVVLRHPFRERRKLRVHLVERHALLQPAQDVRRAAPGPGVFAWSDGKFIVERHPEFLRLGELKSLRHDADDARRFAINANVRPDDVWIAAEIAFPNVVAENRRFFRARLVVVRREITANDRRHANDAEEILGHVTAG